jgi:nucleoside-diphosphate-sugar epimerase
MIPLFESDARGVNRIFSGIAKRVVAISSQDVYRAYGKIIKIETGDPDSLPLTEDSPLRSKLYPYRDKAKTPEDQDYLYDKIRVEKTYMENSELSATILRLPMVYGPGDNRQHRLFNYLKRMDDNRPAIILPEGLAEWRWTKGYVENVAAAIVMAIGDERAAGRIYNVGEPVTLTEEEWIIAIARLAGWRGRIVEVPEDHLPAGYSWGINPEHRLVVDSSCIRQELGYIEPVSFEEGLRRTIAWERANPPEKIDPKLFDYSAEDALLEAFD